MYICWITRRRIVKYLLNTQHGVQILGEGETCLFGYACIGYHRCNISCISINNITKCTWIERRAQKNNVFLPGRREHVVINECLLNNYKISNTKEEQHGGVEWNMFVQLRLYCFLLPLLQHKLYSVHSNPCKNKLFLAIFGQIWR